jgi:hypothetical protein
VPALVASIHALVRESYQKTWMAVTKPGHDSGQVSNITQLV